MARRLLAEVPAVSFSQRLGSDHHPHTLRPRALRSPHQKSQLRSLQALPLGRRSESPPRGPPHRRPHRLPYRRTRHPPPHPGRLARVNSYLKGIRPKMNEPEIIRSNLGVTTAEKPRTIAVIGLSEDSAKPSHYVSAYMQQRGYKLYPVNPSIP